MEARIKERHDDAINKLKTELGAEHDAEIDALAETLDKECAANLQKFKKSITLEY